MISQSQTSSAEHCTEKLIASKDTLPPVISGIPTFIIHPDIPTDAAIRFHYHYVRVYAHSVLR